MVSLNGITFDSILVCWVDPTNAAHDLSRPEQQARCGGMADIHAGCVSGTSMHSVPLHFQKGRLPLVGRIRKWVQRQ